jgi:deoxyadenosine/deoxycytidine kinase
MNQLIAIVGPSGVGKTALVEALAGAGDFEVALEQHSQHPFQALYRQDARYGLANQVDYLLLRAEQEIALRAAPRTALVDCGLDLDYHGFTRLFHSRGLLADPEFDLCRRLYETLRSLLPLPELIVRLRASRETVAGRLSARERINIAAAEDFAAFESFLDEWLSTVEPGRVLEVDASAHDPSYRQVVPGLLARFRERMGIS